MVEKISLAPEEQRKVFTEKLNSPDYYPLLHEIKICAVEFIPFKEFKEKQIKAEDYKTEKENYIEEKSTDLHDTLEGIKSVIEEKGLHVEMLGQSVSNYDPIKSMVSNISCLSPSKLLEHLKELSSAITPPPPENN